MGSRAVVIVCRDPDVAERRFGVAASPGAGAIVTRTGRPFFNDQAREVALLDKVRAAATLPGGLGPLVSRQFVRGVGRRRTPGDEHDSVVADLR